MLSIRLPLRSGVTRSRSCGSDNKGYARYDNAEECTPRITVNRHDVLFYNMLSMTNAI